MKIRKKILTVLFCVLAMALSMFTFTACQLPGLGDGEGNGGGNEHTHSWGEWEVLVEATCGADGVEQRVCSQDSSHKENRPIAKLAHDWNEWEVITEPTCKELGRAERVCKNSSGHVELKDLEKVDHEGFIICKYCGDSMMDATEVSYYSTLIGDLSAGDFAIVVKNFSFSFDGEEDYSATLNTAEAFAKLDENDNVVISGYGSIDFTTPYGEETMMAQFVIDSEAVYVKVDGDFPDTGSLFRGTYALIPIEDVVAQFEKELTSGDQGVLNAILAVYGEIFAWLEDGGLEEIQAFLNENDPLIKGMATLIMQNVFTKTETDKGYVISLNYDLLTDFNDWLYTTTLGDLLQAAFGENALETMRAGADEIVDLSVGEMITFVEEQTGMTINEVIDVIWDTVDLSAMLGMEISKDEIKGFLGSSSLKTMTVGAIIEDLINAEVPEGTPRTSIDTVLDGIFETIAQYQDFTAYDVIGMVMMGSAGGETGGEIIEGANPFNAPVVENPMDMMLASIKQMVDQTLGIFDDVVELEIATDTDGLIQKVTYSANVDLDAIIKLLPSEIKDEIGEMPFNYATNVVVELDPNYQSEIDYDAFVQEVKDYFEEIVITQDMVYDFLVDIYDGEGYTFTKETDGTVTIKWESYGEYTDNQNWFDDGSWSETIRKETINYTVTYYPEKIKVANIECGDWTEVLIPYEEYEDYLIEYYEFCYDANGDLVSETKVDEKQGEDFYDSNLGVYYNFETGVIEGAFELEIDAGEYYSYIYSRHSFEYVEGESVIPEDCSTLGYLVYRCADCGFTYYHLYRIDHDHEYVYELSNGSETCLDGVDCIAICTVCGEEGYCGTMQGSHVEGGELVFSYVDGNFEFYILACLCGEEEFVDGDITFMYEDASYESGYYVEYYAGAVTSSNGRAFKIYYSDDRATIVKVDLITNWNEDTAEIIYNAVA